MLDIVKDLIALFLLIRFLWQKSQSLVPFPVSKFAPNPMYTLLFSSESKISLYISIYELFQKRNELCTRLNYRHEGRTILIFIFVSALVGGISNALADADSTSVNVNEDGANVLVFDLNTTIVERGGAEPFALDLFTMNATPQLGLDQILEGLDRAAQDDDIEGILLNISGVSSYPSTLEDIRAAIEDFKSTGKWLLLGLKACLSQAIT